MPYNVDSPNQILDPFDFENPKHWIPTTTVPEDAASVQLELGRVIRQLQDNQIPTKSAALILYALQIASHNLKRLHDELPFAPPESAVPEHIDQFFDELKRILAEERDSSAPKPAQSAEVPVEERPFRAASGAQE